MSMNSFQVFIRVCPAPSAVRSEANKTSSDRRALPYSNKAMPLHSLQVLNHNTVRVTKSLEKDKDKEYVFDKVFDSHVSQEDIYNHTADHIVDVLEGYNSTVICYGPLRSGKTFTMTGTRDNFGIIPRAFEEVFARINAMVQNQPNSHYYLELCYVEMYNNYIRDLLVNLSSEELENFEWDDSLSMASGKSKPSNSLKGQKVGEKEQKIQIHESNSLGIFLSGSQTLRVPVHSAREALIVFGKGQKARTSRPFADGHVSSRSAYVYLPVYLPVYDHLPIYHHLPTFLPSSLSSTGAMPSSSCTLRTAPSVEGLATASCA